MISRHPTRAHNARRRDGFPADDLVDDAALALAVGLAVAVAADVVRVCDARALGLAAGVVHVVVAAVGGALGGREQAGEVFL